MQRQLARHLTVCQTCRRSRSVSSMPCCTACALTSAQALCCCELSRAASGLLSKPRLAWSSPRLIICSIHRPSRGGGKHMSLSCTCNCARGGRKLSPLLHYSHHTIDKPCMISADGTAAPTWGRGCPLALTIQGLSDARCEDCRSALDGTAAPTWGRGCPLALPIQGLSDARCEDCRSALDGTAAPTWGREVSNSADHTGLVSCAM